ncbi:hypothetical protein LCGC14_0394240 [marine sediment metagenome]|uniref:Uncharacterized protein n=1 Tax=marine sediment metagenome TaxID=412755 RepID=A0A0F9T4I9_9ZZZZ
MAYDPMTQGFAGRPAPEGDNGAGQIYLAHIGPVVTRMTRNYADIFMATGLIKRYRNVYNQGFVHITKSKLRYWFGSFLLEKELHAATIGHPTFSTAYEAVENLLLVGWGHSQEFARHHFGIESPLDLKSIADGVSMADKAIAIKEDCGTVAKAVVESFTVDGWLADGSPDLPWLPTGFKNEDGAMTEMVRGDDFIDPDMYDDGYRYTRAMVDRAALIMWLWINQKIVPWTIEKMNLVDSSRGHVLGTGG